MSSASSYNLKTVFYGLLRAERGRGPLVCRKLGTLLSASCGDRSDSMDCKGATSPLRALSAGLPSPVGVDPLTMRLDRPRAIRGTAVWPTSQVRHLSWRRYVPSMSDFRQAAEAPGRQVTNLLLAINCATYLLNWFDRGVAVNMALIPYQVARGEWYRLLTCGFLHMDFLHILANMLSLHWLGPPVESAAGRGRFAAIYLASILGGSWAQYHFGSFAAASMGASGGVFGLFGAYLVFRLRNRNFIEWDRGDSSWLMQVVAINLGIGLMAGGAISQMAHLGGALTGAAACWLIGPRYRWQYGRLVDQPVLPLFRSRE